MSKKLIPHRHNWLLMEWYQNSSRATQYGDDDNAGGAILYVCSFCDKEY